MARVLVIDDDLQLQSMLSEMLTRLRNTPDVASDGTAGLARFRESHPDLVIADIYMPDRDGIATIREIREIDARVPIVALSGGGRFGRFDLLDAAREAGANRTMRKPVDLEELVDALHELLGAAEEG